MGQEELAGVAAAAAVDVSAAAVDVSADAVVAGGVKYEWIYCPLRALHSFA